MNKTIINSLYQVVVVNVFAISYSMLGKKILKMTPPSIQKFNLEDTGKLVATAAASEMTREYLIKQNILPEHINVQNGQYSMLIGGALAITLVVLTCFRGCTRMTLVESRRIMTW